MHKFLKVDSRKVTYGEYWNIVHSWKVVIPWTAKLLGIPMNFGSGIPAFESVAELEVAEAEYSPHAREKLQRLLKKCQQMGFSSPRYFTHESMLRDTRISFIAMLHPSGATVRLMHSIALKVQPPKEKLIVVLLSELRDGTYFVTSSQRPTFLSPPGIVVNRLIGAGPQQLLESHLQKLKESAADNPAKPVTSNEMLDELWDRYEKKGREFGLQQGRYVWMKEEEAAAGQAKIAEAKAMSHGNKQNVAVLLEINRLRNRMSTWGGIIILFLISLLAFVGASSRSWSWDYLLIVIGILFVHELGHYIAMRAFNYRNVRMFFIPFFGAAVSGQHYNVAGWKKVVVSLMGPLPGIVLGIIFGMAGLVWHQALLSKIALVSLLINGTNLLPVLPLDGGWIFHTLLFSRHYIWDAVFRAAAAAVLICSVTFLHTKILVYVGILMLVGLPAAFRMARIAADLKKRNLPAVAEDDPSIPPQTAQIIIEELQRTTARPQSTKTTAQQTLEIFETINARPPNWGATLGLLSVQAAGLAAAAVFAGGLALGQYGSLRGLFSGGLQIPRHRLAVEPWQGLHANQAAATPDSITVVANFSKEQKAADLFRETTNQLPATAELKRFGESVLLVLPPDHDDLRKQWLEKFQKRTKDVFVDSSNYHAAFSLLCIAPDTNTAHKIVTELNDYFTTLPNHALVPPWQREDRRTPAERDHDELARQTLLKLQEAQMEFMNDAEWQALQKKLETAVTEGDKTAETALRGQIKSKTESLTKEYLTLLRNGAKGPVDTNVFDPYIALNADETKTNRAAVDAIRWRLARRMGQLPLVNGHPNIADERFAAHWGTAMNDELIIRVMYVSFYSISEGPPALVDWLSGQQCVKFRYDFLPGGALNNEDNEKAD